jgi:hypothetical protein
MKVPFRNRFFIYSVLAILVLALSACGGTPPAETGSSAGPAAVSSCPVGRWQMADFSGYLMSFQNEVNSMSSDIQVADLGATGLAVFTFNPDGTSSFSADNFVQNFTMISGAGETSIEIPITLNINGTSTAQYTLEGDQINFTSQDTGDLMVTMVMMGGEPIEIGDSLMGEAGAVKLYQYSCTDANSLSLKVIAVSDMDLAPLLLTRMP